MLREMRRPKISTIRVQPAMDAENYKDTVVVQPVQLAKPLFFCMALSGVQSVALETTVGGSESCRAKKTRLGLYWCALTAVLVWGNILRLAPSYSKVSGFNEDTFIRVVITVWYLQCGINIIVCLRATINKNALPHLFKLWHLYCKQRPFDKNTVSLKRVVRFLTAGYVMFVLSNIGLISYIMYGDDPNLKHFTDILYTPFGEHDVMKVVLLLYQAYIAGTWILPLWLFAIVCIVNKYLLDDTTEAIMEGTDPSTHAFTGDLEVVRLRHDEASDMVKCADDMFSLFVALGLATDIPMWCFVLYMMLWPDTQSSYIVIFNAFLLMMNAFHLCTIMWSASKVNTAAHAAFTRLHKLRTADMSEHNKYQLLVFISRLQGPPIGMTAWQLFTIDRPSLLTIISIILTYFVILIQLRMPGNIANMTGNGTATM